MANQTIQVYGKTDVGMMRTINQDSVFVSPEPIGKLPNLFIVADGMGGHKAGDVASKAAIEKFIKYACTTHMSDPTNILDSGIVHINDEIYKMAESNKDFNGMGTTFVVATIDDKKAYVANVGDSRLYLINHNTITQVTKDHSLVEDMVRMGVIDRTAAANHYKKNVITKAIGVADSAVATPDIFEINLKDGDILLLCSDGLTNMVPDDQILKIVNDSDTLELAVAKLISTANDNGGKDNISAVMVKP